MSNTMWLNTTVVRSAFVAPTIGHGMGDVCPQVGSYSGSLKRRHADAFQATATPGSGLSWSPPVT